jgi:hypothetical protein
MTGALAGAKPGDPQSCAARTAQEHAPEIQAATDPVPSGLLGFQYLTRSIRL